MLRLRSRGKAMDLQEWEGSTNHDPSARISYPGQSPTGCLGPSASRRFPSCFKGTQRSHLENDYTAGILDRLNEPSDLEDDGSFGVNRDLRDLRQLCSLPF